jgi:hypothetical protein
LLLVLAATLTFLYLDGPSATVAVTPSHVVVGNPFVRYQVPRQLFRGFSRDLPPGLMLADGTDIRLYAFAPALVGANARRYPAYHRRMTKLLAAMQAVPETPAEPAVVERKRIPNIVLAVAALLVGLVGIALTLS